VAYVAPTSDEFFDRFPKLVDASDANQEDIVNALIVDAQRQVDDSWLEDDYKTAILYLVAHWIASEASSAVNKAGAIVSESFGPMSRSYSTSATSAMSKSTSDLNGTEYGRRFVTLRKQNHPGIRVVC
jgi:non-homologous end joining protein Ku